MSNKYPDSWREVKDADGTVLYHERRTGDYRVLPGTYDWVAEHISGALVARCSSLSMAMAACREDLDRRLRTAVAPCI